MNQNLKAALDFIIRTEGGYVNDPRDPGGETKHGITRAFLNSLVDYRLYAVKDLTEATARAIYKKYFWDALSCDSLPSGLDIAVFDCAVNQGPGRAHQLLSQCNGSALRFIKLRKDHYLGMNSATEETFEKGWLNRLFDLAWIIRPLVES